MSTIELLEYAAELGDRFPDMPDWHVIEFCGDFAEREFDIHSYIGKACIIAYEKQNATPAAMWLGSLMGLSLV